MMAKRMQPLAGALLVVLITLCPALAAEIASDDPLAAAPPPGLTQLVNLYEVGVGAGAGYTSIRIPVMVVTGDGEILFWVTARKSTSDWAAMDILLRRSRDGGKTWTDPQVFLEGNGSVIDNSTAIVADGGKTIHFLYQTDYTRLWHRVSTDGGQTFSDSRDITSALDKVRSTDNYQWTIVAPGPGVGVELTSGRLVASVWLSDSGTRAHRPSVVTTLYSDDDGQTWQAGDIVARSTEQTPNPSESIPIALPDGGMMLNIRNESDRHLRLVSYSKDGATGWTEPAFVPELYDPICHASMTWVPPAGDRSEPLLVFLNPDSRNNTQDIRKWGIRPRENLTLHVSKDCGKTWPIARLIDPERSGYTAVASSPDGRLYIVCERGYIADNNLNTRWMTFLSLDLDRFLAP